jgi:hypothetical protein
LGDRLRTLFTLINEGKFDDTTRIVKNSPVVLVVGSLTSYRSWLFLQQTNLEEQLFIGPAWREGCTRYFQIFISRVQIAEFFLTCGADPNFQDKYKWNAGNKRKTGIMILAHYACRSSSNTPDILKLLLKRNDLQLDIQNADGDLPLHYLAR